VESSFRLDVRDQDHAAVIVASGELDLASAPELEHELERAQESNVSTLIIDLRPLEFLDSTGLSILIKAHQRAEAAGRRFAVVKGPHQVQRLLALSGLEERLTVIDAPEDLLG
jgi:anti-sigma B factor antagonist